MSKEFDNKESMILEDPEWPKASSWLKGDLARNTHVEGHGKFSVLGVPLSQASPPPHGSHFTPIAIRDALDGYSPFAAGVGWPEPMNIDLTEIVPIDLGNLSSIVYLDNIKAQEEIEKLVSEKVRKSGLSNFPNLTVYLGGDDGIIRPVLKGCCYDISKVGLLTLDAHHDVRVYYRNLGPHNGSPVRGLIDDGLKGENIIQVGISTFTNSIHYRRYCEEKGIKIIGANEARRKGVGICVENALKELSKKCDAIFVDFDLDVTELGFGPACGGAKPGGLSPWEVHEAAFAVGKNPKVMGFCIVEVDSTKDITGSGVLHAALTMLHVAAGFATRRTKII